MEFEIKPYGPTALLLTWYGGINEETSEYILALEQHLIEAQLPGISELVPSYNSLLISLTSQRTDKSSIISGIKSLISEVQPFRMGHSTPWIVPVCYDPSLAMDYKRAEAKTGLSFDEVVHLHSAQKYRAYCVGFLPGFTYLGLLDERISLPRLDTPRSRVPKGSVAIAGLQTGVYTCDSPGGWNIIGRTHFGFFNAYSNPPCRVRPGDTLSFKAITKEEYLSEKRPR